MAVLWVFKVVVKAFFKCFLNMFLFPISTRPRLTLLGTTIRNRV